MPWSGCRPQNRPLHPSPVVNCSQDIRTLGSSERVCLARGHTATVGPQPLTPGGARAKGLEGGVGRWRVGSWPLSRKTLKMEGKWGIRLEFLGPARLLHSCSPRFSSLDCVVMVPVPSSADPEGSSGESCMGEGVRGGPPNAIPTELTHPSTDPNPEGWAGTATDAQMEPLLTH